MVDLPVPGWAGAGSVYAPPSLAGAAPALHPGAAVIRSVPFALLRSYRLSERLRHTSDSVPVALLIQARQCMHACPSHSQLLYFC